MATLRHVDFQVPAWGEFPGGPVVKHGYNGTVLSLHPVAYWRMGEISGVVVHDEMQLVNGTHVNSPALNVSGALPGDPDGAVQYTHALNQCTNFGSVFQFGGRSKFSIVVWVKRTAPYVSSSWPAICGNLWYSGGNQGWYFGAGTWLDPRSYIVRFQNGSNDIVYGMELQQGIWSLMCATYDGAVLSMYGNGQLISQQPSTKSVIPGSNFQIGNRGDNPAQAAIDAAIDEMAIFDYALTAADIRSIYNTGR